MTGKIMLDDTTNQAVAQVFEQSLLGMLYSGRMRARIVQGLMDNFRGESMAESDVLRLHYDLELVYNDVLVASQLAKNSKPGNIEIEKR